MQDIKQQFVKDFQARYEIHPQELGLIADFWLEKLSLAVEQEKERVLTMVLKEIEESKIVPDTIIAISRNHVLDTLKERLKIKQ